MRRPNDTNPDPPGGRAAERLKEFLRERAPAEPSSSEKEEDTEEPKNQSDTPQAKQS
jgi:hypothetical protein